MYPLDVFNYYKEVQKELSALSNYFNSLNLEINQIINNISIRYSNNELSEEELLNVLKDINVRMNNFDNLTINEICLLINSLKSFIGKRSYGNLSPQEKIWIYQDYLTKRFSQKQLADKYLTYQKAIFLTLKEFQQIYSLNPFK